jgi:hypothetical protein
MVNLPPPPAARVRVQTRLAAGAILVIGGGSLWLGMGVAPVYFGGFLLLPYLCYHYVRLRRRYAAALIREQIVAQWGVGRAKKRDFAALRHFYELTSRDRLAPAAPVDDQTWSDLNMNALYAQIDHTFSIPGENTLYEMLRQPMVSAEPLAERDKLIGALERSRALREPVQMILHDLGRTTGQGAADALWTGMPAGTGYGVLFYVLTLAAVVALAASCWYGVAAVIRLVMPVALFNMVVHYAIRNRVARDADTIKYLCRLVNAGAQLASLRQAELESAQQFLKEPLQRTRAVGARSNLMLGDSDGSGDVLKMAAEYISIYFLHEARTYESLLAKIREHGESLRRIYRKVGELDALQAIASYRASLGAYAAPRFREDGPYLEVDNARHPLIAKAIPNSISIRSRGIAITGSNMSGKTTFLRTLAVNVILAQTICACAATSYTGRFLRVVSSINDGDDLLAGKSYFLVEAERLLLMLKHAEGPLTTLCLIDEPLAGTKSVDRHAALYEILRYLLSRNAVGVLSTHDVDLVAELGETFCSYHFGDEVHATGVVSDFRLREGLSYESNAIKLLDHLGYPKAIIAASLERLAAKGRGVNAAVRDGDGPVQMPPTGTG